MNYYLGFFSKNINFLINKIDFEDSFTFFRFFVAKFDLLFANIKKLS